MLNDVRRFFKTGNYPISYCDIDRKVYNDNRWYEPRIYEVGTKPLLNILSIPHSEDIKNRCKIFKLCREVMAHSGIFDPTLNKYDVMECVLSRKSRNECLKRIADSILRMTGKKYDRYYASSLDQYVKLLYSHLDDPSEVYRHLGFMAGPHLMVIAYIDLEHHGAINFYTLRPIARTDGTRFNYKDVKRNITFEIDLILKDNDITYQYAEKFSNLTGI